MLKLLLCIFAAAIIAVLMLQLRQQRLVLSVVEHLVQIRTARQRLRLGNRGAQPRPT